jgi:hypothetical protein
MTANLLYHDSMRQQCSLSRAGATWEMRLLTGALEKMRGREVATEGSYSSTLVKATSTLTPATQSVTQPCGQFDRFGSKLGAVI